MPVDSDSNAATQVIGLQPLHLAAMEQPQPLDAIGHSARLQLLQFCALRVFRRHDQFSTAAVRHAVPGADS